jgi:PAS domain-containing protein
MKTAIKAVCCEPISASMPESHLSSIPFAYPGARALAACGDGFWEFDLQEGSVWFSEWFHARLDWTPEPKRRTLKDLEALIEPGAWNSFMGMLRGHLEQGFPLDVDLDLRLGSGRIERWKLRGRALLNAFNQPMAIAGSVRDVGAEAPGTPADTRLRAAFDALPVAAALLDAAGRVLEVNRRWCEMPQSVADLALVRVWAAGARGSDDEANSEYTNTLEDAGRTLELRAAAFLHEGMRHAIVTLEERP